MLVAVPIRAPEVLKDLRRLKRAGLEPYMIDLPLEEQDMETLAAQKQAPCQERT